MNENSRVRRIFLFSSCAAAAANVDLVDADAVTAAAVFKAAEDDIVVLMLLLDVVVTSGVTNFILFFFRRIYNCVITRGYGGGVPHGLWSYDDQDQYLAAAGRSDTNKRCGAIACRPAGGVENYPTNTAGGGADTGRRRGRRSLLLQWCACVEQGQKLAGLRAEWW